MSAEKKPPFMVQAVYSFKGQNNDEVSTAQIRGI